MKDPAGLSVGRIRELLAPFIPEISPELAARVQAYLELLLRWNARTNLTAIREPERIVQRHFGESFFAALHLPTEAGSLLDIGSGAGFPGLPIAMARPDWGVTLAESQGKKAAFLQEAVRVLGLNVEVWGKRIEQMPTDRRFDVVTLRAVDETADALVLARQRISPGGLLLHLSSGAAADGLSIGLPGSDRRLLFIEKQE